MVATKNGVQHSKRAEFLANRLEQATLLLNESTSLLATRSELIRQSSFDPRRNYHFECGWPRTPKTADYAELFEFDAIGNRVVTVYPDECFAVDPEVFNDFDESKKTSWETAVEDLLYRVPVWNHLHRVDVNAGIGGYGLLVMGYDDGGDLAKPLLRDNMTPDGRRRKERQLIWLQSYDEQSLTMGPLINNPMSPMHGRPQWYDVKMVQPRDLGLLGENVTVKSDQVRVHWSRCLHVTTAIKRSSSILHIPRIKPVLYRVLDLRKCYGGSAEMLWQGGFMGLSVESQPDMEFEELSDDDLKSIRKQLLAYMNSQQRYIATSGMTIKPLHPNVADPTPHIRVQLEAICACIKVPLRVFLGSESGQAAGDQDDTRWNKRVMARNTKTLDPELVRPFYDRQMLVGALPPTKRYYTSWTDLNALSDEKKANVAMKTAQAITQYVTSGAETFFPPLEFLTIILKLPLATAQKVIQSAKNNKKPMTEKAWAKNKPQPMGQNKPSTSFGKRPARNAQQKKI